MTTKGRFEETSLLLSSLANQFQKNLVIPYRMSLKRSNSSTL